MPRGGPRPGSGRPKGRKTSTPKDQRANIAERARQYTAEALSALVQVAISGQSEAARVSAATALLDRGYGKPVQGHEHAGPDGAPMRQQLEVVFVGVGQEGERSDEAD